MERVKSGFFTILSAFSTIFSLILLVLKNRALIWSMRTFPKPPTDWKDGEAVRLFVIALCKSAAIQELAKLVPNIKWIDSMREKLVRLAESTVVWDIVWNIIMNSDVQRDEIRKLTLRERIRARIDARRGNLSSEPFPTSIAETTDIEDLVTAVKTLQLIYDKEAKIE